MTRAMAARTQIRTDGGGAAQRRPVLLSVEVLVYVVLHVLDGRIVVDGTLPQNRRVAGASGIALRCPSGQLGIAVVRVDQNVVGGAFFRQRHRAGSAGVDFGPAHGANWFGKTTSLLFPSIRRSGCCDCCCCCCLWFFLVGGVRLCIIRLCSTAVVRIAVVIAVDQDGVIVITFPIILAGIRWY